MSVLFDQTGFFPVAAQSSGHLLANIDAIRADSVEQMLCRNMPVSRYVSWAVFYLDFKGDPLRPAVVLFDIARGGLVGTGPYSFDIILIAHDAWTRLQQATQGRLYFGGVRILAP